MREDLLPKNLIIRYKTSSALLYSGEVSLCTQGGSSYRFRAEVVYTWLGFAPRTDFNGHVEVKIELSREVFTASNATLAELMEPPENNLTLDIPGFQNTKLVFRSLTASLNGLQIVLAVDDALSMKPKEVTYLDLVIVNGRRLQKEEASLSLEGWHILLLNVVKAKRDSETKELFGVQDKRYEYTQVVRVSKSDNALFNPSSQEVKQLAQSLRLGFSFISASYVDVGVMIGRDVEANEVFRSLPATRVTAYEDDPFHFPSAVLLTNSSDEESIGILNAFLKNKQTAIIERVLSWYLKVQLLTSPEEKIALAQIPLETLAWWYLVDYKKALSEEGFGSLRAGDWLRLFLTFMDVDSAFPPKMGTKDELVKQQFLDGPHAFTAFRNSLIHTSKRNNKRLESSPVWAVRELATLGISYIEASILNIVGYKGDYCPVFQFKTRPVPWA